MVGVHMTFEPGHFEDEEIQIKREIKQDLVATGLEPTASPTVVPLHERSDLECLPDVINIFLPASVLPEKQNVTWREENCGVKFNGTHYAGSVSLSDCGTTVRIENDTVTFSNDLIVHKVADGNQNAANSDITFGSDFETVIPVQCIYPRLGNVSTSYTPVKQNVRFFEKRYGQLDVAMKQFDSEDYQKPVSSAEGSPRKVPLNDNIFIRVGLNFEPEDIKVMADQCIATSSPTPADKNWRQLIQKGCPVNEVRLLSNDSAKDVKFALKAFDFRHNASGFVYIHCQVSVCNARDDTCSMGCSTRARRSALGYGHVDSHLVSTGPLFVERSSDRTKELAAMPTVFAGACLLVTMVAVVLAVVGWTRRPRDRKQHVYSDHM